MIHNRRSFVSTFTRKCTRVQQSFAWLAPVIAAGLCTASITTASAQQMQALHGSPFAGSLSNDYNPATILDAPYRWDVTLFGVQGKTITNAFTIQHYNLFSNTDDADAVGKVGSFRRYLHGSYTLNLLNAQYRINHASAVSFGINLRNYVHAQVSPFYYPGSFKNVNDFFDNNTNVPFFRGNAQNSSWFEYNLGYSRILSENELGRWQGGAQLKIMSGISGATGRINNIVATPAKDNPNDYVLTQGNGYYGYSKNYDALDSNQSFWGNYHHFMQGNAMSLGLNLGVEYVRYNDEYSSTYKPGSMPAEYDWKVAISIMDIGKNKYSYGKYSLAFSGFQPNVHTSQLDSTFGHYNNLHDLNDSIRTIVSGADSLFGKFAVNNPTRLIVNIDKSLPNNFYLNAELSLPFFSTRSVTNINTRETSLITLTPRWETKTWGVYAPIQYTTEGNTWVGLAFKAGPLVVGLHNLAWLFSKSSLPNGGGYLALQIHPWGNHQDDNSYPCPRYPN